MDTASSRLAEIRVILEEEFACDLTDISLEPSLPLGHDGVGLDSLMIVDLLARLESRYSVDVDLTDLVNGASGVTVQDLLRITDGLPQR
ncbi:acyl carrier protein [Streptomyces sp. NEAU-W12]|uniref:acyl carrier protein n=1 Tax=Streptomyces sp. NEAU-W12 TaxID=2994668 RepID=UPI00224AD499|nr:acyl carrier protein [Streptomyces sp. NEAU-W12]MCX2926642.1 acyl carrier protein [Streptomyces sp. NEAU-W12]